MLKCSLFKILIALCSASLSSFVSPLRRKPIEFGPIRMAGMPSDFAYGQMSNLDAEAPETIAISPILVFWWNTLIPPKNAPKPTSTWPAIVAPFAIITSFSSLQLCAIWAYAIIKQLSPKIVALPSPEALFMVTNSLIWQFLPIITFVFSLL